ncbi:MAG TPA: DUF3558 family protein [Actinophytocola sp.]|uniref:DUF3558 family protein n=1 Tax=Actinophytocola sp. TaxID=1872138 RepID=UPI002DBEDF57|nr:DUF3558 family protein [Actinophytocola sp.]HEU5469337.1 DUF3558 family protein [Actinophytocola sp.]
MNAAAFAVIVLIGALAAGCSGDPEPPAAAGTRTSGGVALAVPAVPNPLDTNGFRDAPCQLIPEQRAGELGVPVAEEERTGSRLACVWRAGESGSNAVDVLSVRVQTDSGLAAIAQQCEGRDGCASWTVATIGDYPVIRANGELESRHGLCRLFVGVADRTAIMVTDGDLDAVRKGTSEGGAGGPRCDRAERAATARSPRGTGSRR